MESIPQKFCPHCKTACDPGAAQCPACGRSLSASPKPAGAVRVLRFLGGFYVLYGLVTAWRLVDAIRMGSDLPGQTLGFPVSILLLLGLAWAYLAVSRTLNRLVLGLLALFAALQGLVGLANDPGASSPAAMVAVGLCPLIATFYCLVESTRWHRT